MPLKRCVLVGGAPLTGKSTLGRSLAEDDDAVLLATDALRDWMQAVVRPEDRPALFFGRDRVSSPQEMLDAQLAQGLEVQHGTTALLRTRYLPWERIVIEGIALTPAYMVQLRETFDEVEVELIVLRHAPNGISRRLQRRGLWSGRPGAEPNADRELAWLEMFDRHIFTEAERHSLGTRVVDETRGETA